MEKSVHRRPVSEEDEALSRSRKLRLEGQFKEEHSEEEMQKLYEFDYKGKKAEECSPVSEETGKYTLFIDSRYKLPLYLSEFALVEFNAIQKAKCEKVNVLETMKLLDVDKGTTYLITFEASLPDDMINNAQTFQTKIFMALLDSTTKIDIKFVRIKLSEFDYNVEEECKENLSESDEEEEETDSESDEGASDSDEEDTEEMLSESDEKDTELKLSESDKKDCEQEKLSEFEEDDSEEEELLKSDDEELSEYSNEMKQYHTDVEKSDGFEIGNYRHVKTSCCMIRRYYDPPARTQSTTNLNRLVYLSQLAICVYNMKEDTCFDNVKVLKAMAFGCGRTNYNITFEASLSDGNDVITFQTRIYTSLPFPYRKIEIKFVRIKPSINPIDITN